MARPFQFDGENFRSNVFFRWSRGAEVMKSFGHRMKRPNAPAPKQVALARKRALIRSLIEQHGWATPPTPAPSRHERDRVGPAVPGNVIPFPTPGK
jgi:hypothetical protein